MSVHVCRFLKPLGPLVSFFLEHEGGARNLVTELLAITVFLEVLFFIL